MSIFVRLNRRSRTAAMAAWCLALPLFAMIIQAQHTTAAGPASAPTTKPSDEGQSIIIANARQYDLLSKLNNKTYRLMVYMPPKTDPAKSLPVVYVLDGNWYFGTACDAMAINQLNGIVVGIGYPTDDREEQKRLRTFDLSLPTASGSDKYGGGDAFLKMIDEEIKPFIQARYNIDTEHQSLYGHSLGGLMVLRQMFRNSSAYSTYLAASPSIWWNSRSVLADEEAFSKNVHDGSVHLTLLLTSAADEQYHGQDPKLLASAQKVRMVDNATDLAGRLSALDPKNLKVTRQMISGETHTSGSGASICRALGFTLKEAEK